MDLHHLALQIILALAALGLAWSTVLAPRRSAGDDSEAAERGFTTILQEDR